MRKFISTIISLLIIAGGIYFFINRDNTIKFIIHKYNTYHMSLSANEYTKYKDYISFQRTDDFSPENKDQLINVFYTILDDGMNSFTFYCDYDCKNDIKEITEGSLLETMNNYVHPYNSYETFNITASSYDVIDVSIIKLYTNKEIEMINTRMSEINDELKKNNFSLNDQIKAFHDYIINNTTYKEEDLNDKKNIKAHKAYNVLFNHEGICSGYTDTLAIYLNYIGIDNFKVSSKDHIWNAVYLNNWYNIDMTWDDPVTSNGKDMLLHDYYLLTKEELLNKDTITHSYNDNLYQELN